MSAVKAHIILYFEDAAGNLHPSIANNPGSGVISGSGTTVNGSLGTIFTTELKVGYLILVAGQVRQITSITSNILLTVDAAFTGSFPAQEYTFQPYTTIDPAVEVDKTVEGAVEVITTARDFGDFESVQVRLLLFSDAAVLNRTLIDVAWPYLINDIGKSLHLSDDTTPRSKQRQYKLYRMALANPDPFTPVEAGLVGLSQLIEEEPVALSGVDFTQLDNQNLFPFSESLSRMGLAARGYIFYTGQPTSGDTITIGSSIFTFGVNVTIGGDADTTFQNLVDAINTTSGVATATLKADKHTVLVEAQLLGTAGNRIIFSFDCSAVKLTPRSGFLDGGSEGAAYTRDVDYTMLYAEGEIARVATGAIPDPSPPDLVLTYSYFPAGIPLNQAYPQTVKPVAVKLEPDSTCLFFFRGRVADFTNVDAVNTNFEVVARTPDRFSYLRPTVRGRYTQVVHFSGSMATLDYKAKIDLAEIREAAVLVQTKADGTIAAIPQSTVDSVPPGQARWHFSSSTQIMFQGTYDADAEYEFAYFVQFQFTTAPFTIADPTSPYALLPYSFKRSQVNEEKVDAEQVLFLNENRQATLRLPAILDQGLAELSRSLGGETEILSDASWGFIDEKTVEVFLGAFSPAAIYRLTYQYSRLNVDSPVSEQYEFALSSNGDFSASTFTPFVPGTIHRLDNWVMFRVTAWGDFDVDDYRVRGFGGIVNDAALSTGGFGISPFGRYPFGDGGVCLDEEVVPSPPAIPAPLLRLLLEKAAEEEEEEEDEEVVIIPTAAVAEGFLLTLEYDDLEFNAAFPFSSPGFVGGGSIWVSDTGHNKIIKFTEGGDYAGVEWGSSGSGDGQFSSPQGVVVSGSTIYVVDRGNNRIQYFNLSGTFQGKWGSSGAGDGQFNTASGVTVDGSGNVYVADSSNNRIQKFNSTGTFLTKWGTSGAGDGQFSSPNSIFWCSATDELYVTDSGNNRVQVFNTSGTFQRKWGSSGSGDGQFLSPKGIAVSADGNTVYVADTHSRVEKFTSSGTFLDKFFFPFTGQPKGIALDVSGNVYTVVGGSGVLKTDSSGTFLGTTPYPTGTVVSSPAGISFPTTPSAHFADGTVVTLTATPNTNFVFSVWGVVDGDLATETANPDMITMNADKNVKVTFIQA